MFLRALVIFRTQARILRSGLTLDKTTPNHLRSAFDRLETLIDQHCDHAKLAA